MNEKNQNTDKTLRIVTAGVFAAMITIMTAFIFHIPYGANGGYIHFGDVLIYFAAVLLPRRYALAAAALGGGIADMLTAPMWAPATIIIKILIVLPFSSEKNYILTLRNRVAPMISAVICIAGYYIAEGIIFGSYIAPVTAIPGNVIQSAGSAVIYFVVATVFDKSHVKNRIQEILHLI